MNALSLCVVLAVAAPAVAQVQVTVDLPNIVFPAPPTLVVIEPGVQVVQDRDDEVFFVDNWYWHRRGGRWYRNQTHNGTWVVVEDRIVPRPIVAFAPGHYRRWHGHGPGKLRIKEKGHKHH